MRRGEEVPDELRTERGVPGARVALGRPVAQWREEAGGKGGGGGLTFLATDHLGSPACALAGDASVTWSGGFEPFGRDWQHGTPEGALASGLFLRLPGQWDHPYWHRDLRTKGFGADLFYNVHRWYEAGTGRYVSADPLGLRGSSALQVYGYSEARPTVLADPLGLCTCGDECPGGEWAYSGESVLWVPMGAGITYSRGQYSCRTNPDARVRVRSVCAVLGVFMGAGVAFDTSTPLAPGACGCSREDLLGEFEYSVSSIGPAGATTGQCDPQESIWRGPRTSVVSVGPSTRVSGGWAWLRCRWSERNGWL